MTRAGLRATGGDRGQNMAPPSETHQSSSAAEGDAQRRVALGPGRVMKNLARGASAGNAFPYRLCAQSCAASKLFRRGESLAGVTINCLPSVLTSRGVSGSILSRSRIGRSITSELDHSRLAQIAIDAATELTGAQFGAMFYSVADERIDSYMLYAVSGVPREQFAKITLPRITASTSGKLPASCVEISRARRATASATAVAE